MNEYATDITSGRNTYIMHLDDKNPESNPIMTEDVNTDPDFQEMTAKNRIDARMRNFFMPDCNIENLKVLLGQKKNGS